MKKLYFFAIIPAVMLPVLCTGCDSDSSASGTLEISYTLNTVEGVVPSYQTVIWLEDEEGNMKKSLMVSEYLSFGGFKDTTVCPAWSAKSNWAGQKQAELVAVTAATPKTQPNKLVVDWGKIKLPPGTYRYHVQTHIVENYNIIYSGVITIEPGTADQDVAKGLHTPKEHPKASAALNDVSARYY